MQTITPLTSEGTETTLNRSDTQMPTMSLGGGAQMQSVTGTGVSSVKDAGAVDNSLGGGGTMPNRTEPKIQETKEDPRANMSEEELKAMYEGQEDTRYPETKTEPQKEETQGEKGQIISNAEKDIEKYNELLDQISNASGSKLYDLFKDLTKEQQQNIYNILSNTKSWDYNKSTLGEKGAWNNLPPDSKKLVENALKDIYNKNISNARDTIYNTKNDGSYDNRTDQQTRDDNAYQRLVDDMRLAGLNPASFKGANYGGGGGSGSKSEEEEEKRKRRRREKFEQDRAKNAEKMRQTELITGIVTNLMGTATKGVGAGLYMANQNKLAQASQAHQKEMQRSGNIHQRYMIEAEKLAGNKKYRKGEDW